MVHMVLDNKNFQAVNFSKTYCVVYLVYFSRNSSFKCLIKLGQHWFSYWLATYQHQAITDFDSSVRSEGIHMWPATNFTEMFQINKWVFFFIIVCLRI